MQQLQAESAHDFSGPNADLVSVSRALEIVLGTALQAVGEDVALDEAVGRVLAETLKASDDLPRYDMVSIDGIAVASATVKQGSRFAITSTQRAGTDRVTLQDSTASVEVMAGCILPGGTECIIPYEDVILEDVAGQRFATIRHEPKNALQYIHRRAADRAKGDLLVESGVEITAAEISVAASIGRTDLRVAKLPRVAVVTTGDELVPMNVRPLPWQMRESNSHALSVILKQVGVDSDRFHLPDDPDVIASSISEWTMTYDILLLSGGSSKGIGDFLPSVLKEIGIVPYFHGVSQRPGKPFWFGQKPEHANGPLTVFALPGNPVSSFVCTLKYCLPWLEKSFGRQPRAVPYARLSRPLLMEPGLTHFIPVRLKEQTDGMLLAEPQSNFHGSGDIAGLLGSDAFIELPPDRAEFKAGETYPIIRYR